MHARHEIDEVGIDGNLCHLITEQGDETEHKHLVMGKELAYLRALLDIFLCLYMLNLGQVYAREHQGYQQHQDAQDGIRNHHIAAIARTAEEELTDAECGKDAAQAIE